MFAAILLLLACCGPALADGTYPVGLGMVEATDPVSGRAVKSLIWYPSRDAGGPTRIGPFELAATRGAAPAAGPFPLILISHGNEGSHLAHRDSAQALAEAGYVVASLLHAGDNFEDSSLLGSETLLSSRPKSVSAVIDALLADKALPIDGEKIGFLGFSAGGYTGLALLGAQPSYAQAAIHCRDHAYDPICRYAPLEAGEPLPITDLAEPRIRAAVLLDPLTWNFSDAALAAVKVPVYLMRPERDDVLSGPLHAERLARIAPGIIESWMLPGAGHFSFVAPFPEALKAEIGPIAQDGPGFDRRAAHEEINQRIVAFFGERL